MKPLVYRVGQVAANRSIGDCEPESMLRGGDQHGQPLRPPMLPRFEPLGTTWVTYRPRRMKVSHCRCCDYDLKGLAEGVRCPECGVEDPGTKQLRSGRWEIRSASREAAVVLGASSLLVVVPVQSKFHWDWLYATSHWGPMPWNSAGFPNIEIWLISLFVSVFTAICLNFSASTLPWVMTKLQLAVAILGVWIASSGVNAWAVHRAWQLDHSIYLDQSFSPAIYIPHYMVAGSSGMLLAACLIQLRLRRDWHKRYQYKKLGGTLSNQGKERRRHDGTTQTNTPADHRQSAAGRGIPARGPAP